jgi:hypothetical protein
MKPLLLTLALLPSAVFADVNMADWLKKAPDWAQAGTKKDGDMAYGVGEGSSRAEALAHAAAELAGLVFKQPQAKKGKRIEGRFGAVSVGRDTETTGKGKDAAATVSTTLWVKAGPKAYVVRSRQASQEKAGVNAEKTGVDISAEGLTFVDAVKELKAQGIEVRFWDSNDDEVRHVIGLSKKTP